MSDKELKACKKYINSNISKGFIMFSLALYTLLVLFVKKPSRGLQFCVDYQKLNVLTKKNKYLLPLINKTLA